MKFYALLLASHLFSVSSMAMYTEENMPQAVQELIQAVNNNETEKAILLLESGVKPQQTPKQGDGLIIPAAAKGNLPLVSALLKHNAPLHGTYSSPAAGVAAFFGHLDVLDLLLDHGANIQLAEAGVQRACFYPILTMVQLGQVQEVINKHRDRKCKI